MLKIKENIDLKTLKKYGFRPKYNEWTGECEKYILFGTFTMYDSGEHQVLKESIIIDVLSRKIGINERYFRTIELKIFYDMVIDGIVEKEEK